MNQKRQLLMGFMILFWTPNSLRIGEISSVTWGKSSMKCQHLNSQALYTGKGCDNWKTNFVNLTLHKFYEGYFFQKRPPMHCKMRWLYDFFHSCKCFAVQNDAWSQVRWLHTACWQRCIFSPTKRYCMGEDRTTRRVRTMM